MNGTCVPPRVAPSPVAVVPAARDQPAALERVLEIGVPLEATAAHVQAAHDKPAALEQHRPMECLRELFEEAADVQAARDLPGAVERL